MSEIYLYILFGAALLIALLSLTWIDIKTYRLPNYLTFSLMCLGLLQAYSLPQQSIQSSLIGLLIGYCGFVALEKAFRQFYKKDGLGRGDAKLLAAGGAWCGWFGLPYIVLIASLCGLTFTQLPSQKEKLKNGQSHIAFGPFLCLGIGAIWASQIYFLLR